MAQEGLIKASKIPYTIVRSTQFFEFLGGIAQFATEGEKVRLPSALMQPIAADDVAAILADIAAGEPLNGMVEIAGPEPIRMGGLVHLVNGCGGYAELGRDRIDRVLGDVEVYLTVGGEVWADVALVVALNFSTGQRVEEQGDIVDSRSLVSAGSFVL
jgi:hypothetical protein